MLLQSLFSSVRIAAVTMAVCVGGYATVVWAFAQTVTPFTASGSILTAEDGTVIGSRQIAQAFTQPGYFWPRPSAVDYNGAGAGGSNLSPTSEAVRERAEALVALYGATDENPLPADLAAASGAGLDPHISLAAALYQAPRVAEARGVPVAVVEGIVDDLAASPGSFLTEDRIVNVLDLNLALDRL